MMTDGTNTSSHLSFELRQRKISYAPKRERLQYEGRDKKVSSHKATAMATYILLFLVRFLSFVSCFVFLQASSSSNSNNCCAFIVNSMQNKKNQVSTTTTTTRTSESRMILIPSQTMKKQQQQIPSTTALSNDNKKNIIGDDLISLVPSQISSSSNNDTNSSSNSNRTSKATRRKGSKGNKKKTSGKKSSTRRKNNSNYNNGSKKPRRHGDFPDFAWRAIPIEHMRSHPNFEPLPLPESIKSLDCLEDIRRFRQESWQWDTVHEGRCTTSQAVAALGFLEPEAGKILGVPKSWHRGSLGAFHRLRRPALQTLEEMNAVLCSHGKKDGMQVDVDDIASAVEENDGRRIWAVSTHAPSFAAKYMVDIDEEERERRKHQLIHHYSKSPNFDFSIRMIWGNVQEATALLTGINFFQQDGVIMEEIGMCGAGIEISDCKNLRLGATPDGLLCYPDGRKEVLEVKNHCPFVPSRNRNNNNNQSRSRFEIRHCNFGNHHGVLPHYVPQLMLEMLCVGPDCRSAIMIRQSALSGALILRIERDDDWIEEMLYWLKRFQTDYVDANIPPPQNVFLENPDDSVRYRKFLDWTKRIESKVTTLSHVPHAKIQRATGNIPGSITDLFFD